MQKEDPRLSIFTMQLLPIKSIGMTCGVHMVDHIDVKQKFKRPLRGRTFPAAEKSQDVTQAVKKLPTVSPSLCFQMTSLDQMVPISFEDLKRLWNPSHHVRSYILRIDSLKRPAHMLSSQSVPGILVELGLWVRQG